jgi:hypothetical protein
MQNLKDLKASFDKAKDKIKQASSKNTTLKLKGYHELKVQLCAAPSAWSRPPSRPNPPMRECLVLLLLHTGFMSAGAP